MPSTRPVAGPAAGLAVGFTGSGNLPCGTANSGFGTPSAVALTGQHGATGSLSSCSRRRRATGERSLTANAVVAKGDEEVLRVKGGHPRHSAAGYTALHQRMSPEAWKVANAFAAAADLSAAAAMKGAAGRRQYSPGETFAGGPRLGNSNAQRPTARERLHHACEIGNRFAAATAFPPTAGRPPAVQCVQEVRIGRSTGYPSALTAGEGAGAAKPRHHAAAAAAAAGPPRPPNESPSQKC